MRTICVWLLIAQAPAPPAAKAVRDEALTIARTHSLHRNEIPWPVVEPQVRALAGGAQKSADAYPAIKAPGCGKQ